MLKSTLSSVSDYEEEGRDAEASLVDTHQVSSVHNKSHHLIISRFNDKEHITNVANTTHYTVDNGRSSPSNKKYPTLQYIHIYYVQKIFLMIYLIKQGQKVVHKNVS